MIPELSGDFLQWLRGFYYVATTGSVSRAAEVMNRNQSSITYQLQSLERSLNNVLFIRVKNQMTLTDAGEALLKWSIVTFDAIAGLHNEVACVNGKLRGFLHISSNRPTLQHPLVVRMVTQYTRENPAVHIHLTSAFPDELCHNVEIGQSDFALIGQHNSPSSCAMEILFRAPYFLVVAKDHAYELDENPSREQLAKIPFLRFLAPNNLGSATRFISAHIDELMPTHALLSGSNYQVLLQYVAQGLGAAILDAWSLSVFSSLTGQVRLYPLRAYLPDLPYGLLQRKKAQHSPAALRFMEMSRQTLQGLDLTLSFPELLLLGRNNPPDQA